MIAMAAELGEAGAEVTVVTPASWPGEAASAEEIAAYYEAAPRFEVASRRSVYPSIRGIEKLAQGAAGPLHPAARSADLIYTRTLPIMLGAVASGRSVLYETYRPWPDQKPLSRPLFRWIGRQDNFLGAVLHSRLAHSSYLRAGVPARKLLVAHNGYDPSLLEPVISPEKARAQLGLPTERPIVVYTGRIKMTKGLDLALKMAAVRPEVMFVLVGSEGRGEVERKAEALGNVRMAPWMPAGRTVPYLYSADVLLIPPVSGPLRKVGNTVLPLKTFLYMAAERAILAPDMPDLRELLEDGRNAALAPPDDLDEILERLDVLLNDSALRRRLARRAREDVLGQTWTRRAERVLEFLQKRLSQVR